MGFIAQDIDELINEFDYNDQGLITQDDEGRYNLRYNDFIALLTRGMQEQQEMIMKQGELIEDLQREIEKLKN